jgi:predicted GNAT family acetyltransferase
MRCLHDEDVAGFLRQAQAWLEREPVLNNVLYSLALGRLRGDRPVEAGAQWLRVLDDAGAIQGTAIQLPPRGLLLGAMSPGCAAVLAEDQAAHRPDLAGVDGPIDVSDAFQERFTQLTSVGATPTMNTRIFRADAIAPPDGVPGEARTATAADRDLLVAWARAFQHEAIPRHADEDPAGPIDSLLARGDLLWVWQVDGEVRSTAHLSLTAAGMARVSGVYTPPALRGRGYASAVVAAVSQAALDTDAAACMLYTDLANPTSNKIYQQVGYRPVAYAREWAFSLG